MRRLICASCLGFISMFTFAYSEQDISLKEEPTSHEMTFTVPTKNLYFDNDEMMVVIDEHSFPVRALQRSGNHWRVQVVSAGYCQMGHNLCGNCSMCHLRGCIYYIRPCKLWDPE